jgi:hypothetical protein
MDCKRANVVCIENILSKEDEIMQPTMTVDSAGDKIWRLPCGRFHREDGPAVEYDDGTKFWYLNDKLHRTDGPAIEYADGASEWWLYGERLSFDSWIEITIGITDEEKVMLKLQYG